ncbi:glycosyltransferase family 39 protein [Candidatus Woesebacteria bacterium]|nr:MAG: glycosyltransferase family 39 protein [Candidatus Woesebacteria bacterium]
MKRYLLFAIFLAGLILRVINLSSLPAGFTPDEASFGYDAYSLLHTGKDQWGHTLPIVFESFGDFKLPLYGYLLIPFVALFGLSEWVVRLPNALIGSSTVIVTYYFVYELFKVKIKHAQLIAIIATLLIAVSPWHIMMSRGGFEANLTTFLIPCALYLFLLGLKNSRSNHRKILLSGLILGINMFSYHSARLVTPILVALLFTLYSKRLVRYDRKYIIGFVAIFGFFATLTIYSFMLGAGRRVSDVSVYSGSQEFAAGPRLDAINGGMDPVIAKIIHNRFIVTTNRFFENYKQYYSLKFLVDHGPAEATYGMIPGRGVIYPFELILLFAFLVGVVKYRHLKEMWLIVFWLVCAPIPAALSTGVGFAGNRSVIMLPALQIAMAIGAYWILTLIRIDNVSVPQRRLLVITLAALIGFNLIEFSYQYFGKSAYVTAPSMLYGRKDMVKYLNNIKGYQFIIVSRTLSEPHIYFAFYNEYDPKMVQGEAKNWGRYRDLNLKFLDQLGSYSLGNIKFENIDFEKRKYLGKTLLVGKKEEFPLNTVPEYEVAYPSGETAIYFVNPSSTEFALK